MASFPTSTETLKTILERQVHLFSKNGEYLSRSYIVDLIKKKYDLDPYEFGLTRERNAPQKWDTIYGSFRSAETGLIYCLTHRKSATGTSKTFCDIKDLKVIESDYDGERYYYIDGILQKAQLEKQTNPNFTPILTNQSVKIDKDSHTDIQSQIVELGILAGYQIHVPSSDRTKKLKNGSTIQEKFSENLVSEFDNKDKRTSEIDVLWLFKNKVVRAFEVEISTGVVDGLSRMSSLDSDVKCHIVSYKEEYEKKFKLLMETDYRNTKMFFTYTQSNRISKELNNILNNIEAYDSLEINKRYEKFLG